MNFFFSSYVAPEPSVVIDISTDDDDDVIEQSPVVIISEKTPERSPEKYVSTRVLGLFFLRGTCIIFTLFTFVARSKQ